MSAPRGAHVLILDEKFHTRYPTPIFRARAQRNFLWYLTYSQYQILSLNNRIMSATETTLQTNVTKSREALDAWVREVIQWHFDPATGCPFWLDYAGKLSWDPREEIQTYDDLSRFGFFEDEWLREGNVRRWVPRGYADRPVYTFETGGSTGVPKSRINIEDFRLDYEAFSDTLPDEFFPRGANWLSLGPTGPTPFASGRRTSDAVSRRHLFHG